ncbi:MAG: SMC-Scp complex subunit ScpB [Verrucomicrobiae bacterium]|nr:SMC-Scp complex subunit ScpB [Verrucomicrobiae bacterium]
MELKLIVEALLFSTHKPLAAKQLTDLISGRNEDEPEGVLPQHKKLKEAQVAAAIEELKVDYIQLNRSFQIQELSSGFQLVSKPEFGPWLKRMYEDRPNRLSQPALETLAIIAIRQPITRADIEGVRGVAIDGVMKTLLERGLVKITGRAEVPGRPLQYGVSQKFLDHFGLRSIEDLPDFEQLKKKYEAAKPRVLVNVAENPMDQGHGHNAPVELVEKQEAKPSEGNVPSPT